MLDVNSPDKGLLIPHMEITDVNSDATPVTSPADGLLIYNTGNIDVPAGVYRWSSTDTEWLKVITSNSSVIQNYGGGYGGYIMQWGG